MMELLNNIWNVLITPNELYTKLITLPLTFLEVYLTMSLFLTILNISVNKKQKFIYFIINSFINIVGYFLIPDTIRIFVSYIITFFMIMLIFKLKPFKSLIAIVV